MKKNLFDQKKLDVKSKVILFFSSIGEHPYLHFSRMYDLYFPVKQAHFKSKVHLIYMRIFSYETEVIILGSVRIFIFDYETDVKITVPFFFFFNSQHLLGSFLIV